MGTKRNDIEVEDVTSTSQYDGMQVLKDAHSLPGHYIRTKESLTLVSSYFDNFTVTYDSNENPIEVYYFAGTKAHVTEIGCLADSNGSLASTYFIISTGRKEARYAIYFTVDAVGTAPSISGVTNIEVALNLNDNAQVVAFAVEQALNSINGAFKVTRSNAVVKATTTKLGVTNNTIDAGTGFIIQNTEGDSQKVEEVLLKYSNDGNPIWQSQELKGYKYNIYNGRFVMSNGSFSKVNGKKTLNVLNANEVIWDEIATTFPDTVTDLYTYSYQGTPVQTVTVTYGDTAKNQILSVLKERL